MVFQMLISFPSCFFILSFLFFIARTLSLILQELISTERDYVWALQLIVDNYIPEIKKEDVPQALRGKRNVIFGNIEKIYEFHSQHFLQELENCKQRPFQIAQTFLSHVSNSISFLISMIIIFSFLA